MLLKVLGLTAGVTVTGNKLGTRWGVAEAEVSGQASAQTAATPAAAGPYKLPPLPYAYDALEPYIDAETMHLHHDKHHASYVEKLNAAVAGHPDVAAKPVDELMKNLDAVPEEIRTAVRNQGGGHWNHSFFWQILSTKGGSAPTGVLAQDITAQLGGFQGFHDQFAKAAASVFGSGWAWLTLDKSAKLHVETTANQDCPLTQGRTPVVGIDVWEHAYYLKYQNRRPEYVAAFFNAVNWERVSEIYVGQKAACNPDAPCKVTL
ncbi:superoxide dismutase [Silvibacterium dinghuense]|uniref:superoxide dismutase n=2 Tax=Silvibacterium dinghuense TaxID=1560006 RepID=A0A4Q1SAB8_9BACT|nr:superoxide dismutase [Silvibacterium dinghuense]